MQKQTYIADNENIRLTNSILYITIVVVKCGGIQ